MAIGRPVSLTNNVSSKTISVTATAGQTLFTVAGGYRINQLLVYRNGVKLAQSNDFIASDGATVTLVTPANAGDNVDFQVFDDFKVADAIVSAASSQTIQGDLAVNGNLYFNNDNYKTHNAIYGTYGCCPGNYFDFQRMIRKDGYKLMLFPKNKRIELYDLNNDPYEINNLADNSNYKSKVKDLYEELIILQKEMGDTLKLDMYFKNKL